MKREFLFVGFISALLLLVGCAQKVVRNAPQETQETQETADPYFRPKRVYALDMNQAWNLTLKALNREEISLEMVNRETGLIRTDYQNLSVWERNQCDLQFSQEPQRKTFIYVRCRYDSRNEATERFRDSTYSAPRKAMKAEEDLYRKIEPHLLPFERTPMAQEGVETPLAPTAVISPAPLPGIAEVKPEPTPSPGVSKTPSHQPEAPAPLATPSDLPTGEPEIIEEPLITYVTVIEPAKARMAPSIQSKVITVLKGGEQVEKVGESGVWTKIELASGEMAWVHRDLVREVSPQQETPSTPTSPVEEKTSFLSPPVTEAYRETPGETSFRQTAKAGGPVKKDGAWASKNFLVTKLVTKEVVKMRLKPSLTSKVVLVLKKGRAVEKIGESGEFIKVRLSWGVTGWILTRSLKKVR